MGTIIPLFTSQQEPSSELDARRRTARLDRATGEDMRTGLELLFVVDPVAFDVALPAKRPDPAEDPELGKPVAVCGRCRGFVALLPEEMTWRHYRGSVDVAGVQEPFDAGHEPVVEWVLVEDLAGELLV